VRSSLRFGTGLETRLDSSSPLFVAAPPPLRRVRPEVVVAMGWCGWNGRGVALLGDGVRLPLRRRDAVARAAYTLYTATVDRNTTSPTVIRETVTGKRGLLKFFLHVPCAAAPPRGIQKLLA